MYKVDKTLENKLREFNREAKARYKSILKMDNVNFRKHVEENIGEIVSLESVTKEKLEEYRERGGVVGVDGSVNRKGSAHPHYIEFYRALAKSTKYPQKDIYMSQIYSPLLKEEEAGEEVGDQRDRILSKLEVEVAIKAAQELDPFLIIMDGSFIRYVINCREEWENLRYICESREIYLVGAIEEMKTDILSKSLKESNLIDTEAYDKELLYGRLDYGEMIVIKDRVNTKSLAGELSSVFMRSGLDPNVIGLDIIDRQRKNLREMANLIFTLTPENSRGIPLWMDIVDEEVKISHELMEGYLGNYVDRDIYERFLQETRSKRN